MPGMSLGRYSVCFSTRAPAQYGAGKGEVNRDRIIEHGYAKNRA